MEIHSSLLNICKSVVLEKKLMNYENVGRHSKYSIENIFKAIFFILKTGCQWYVLDFINFGSSKTIHKYFIRFSENDVFSCIWKHVLDISIKLNKLDYSKLSIDASLIKNRRGVDCLGKNNCDRGRKGSKHSIITTKNGIPISSIFSPANVHDVKLLEDTFNSIICNKQKPSRKKPQYVLADKGYDSEKHRQFLREKGYIPKIPLKKNSVRKLTTYQKRLYVHDKDRNKIEIVFGRLDNFKRLTMRNETYIKSYNSFTTFALSIISFKLI